MTFQRLIELVLSAAALCRADLALPPPDEPLPEPRDHRHRAASNRSDPAARQAPTAPDPTSANCSSDPHRLCRFRQTPERPLNGAAYGRSLAQSSRRPFGG